jgi:hypothetical protein
VSYQTPAAGIRPSTALRPAANNINFNFDGFGDGPLQPGLNAALLVVQTNAPAAAVRQAAIIDSGAISVDVLSPVPEPASLGVLGFVAAAALRRRRANA